MIRFNGKFMRYRLPHSNSPTGAILNWKEGDNFWCSFELDCQQIMCQIFYKEDVDSFECFKYYKCVVSLPYGEKFPPYSLPTKDFSDTIDLEKEYNLTYGVEIFGKCVLEEVVEIISDYYGVLS